MLSDITNSHPIFNLNIVYNKLECSVPEGGDTSDLQRLKLGNPIPYDHVTPLL